MRIGLLILGMGMASCLSGCAELQVKRDLQHEELSQRYRAALNQATEFDLRQACTRQAAAGAWTSLDVTPTTPLVELPTGVNAAAVCVSIPTGARAIEIRSDGQGGSSYYQQSVVHPSLLFLSKDFSVVKDVQAPRLSPDETLFSGFGLSGVVVLKGDLSAARSLVVYVHPLSLDGAVSVMVPGATIPVPYAPYGKIKLRFQ